VEPAREREAWRALLAGIGFARERRAGGSRP